MKNIITLSILFLLISFQASAQENLSQDFELRNFQIIKKEGKSFVHLSLFNKGKLYSYPVVQVLVNQKVLANKEGRFDTYAILENSEQAFVFPISIEGVSGETTFTITITSGMDQKTQVLKHTYTLD